MANEQLEKYLKLARRAKEEDNTEDAKKYYDMVRTEDPDNVEARFFYSYYRLWDGTKGESFGKYLDFCKTVSTIVRAVQETDAPDEFKKSLLVEIFNSIKGTPISITRIQKDLWQSASDSQKPKYNSQQKESSKVGIEMLYGFGDNIAKAFANDAGFTSIAVDSWKAGVALNQQYPYCGIDKTLSDKYIEKIKSADPSYTPPKKAGCISFG